MLMMLGVGRGVWEKGGPADAHEAGRGRCVREIGLQLMLMMLGMGVAEGKQLMLMMLGVGAASGKRRPS